MRKIVLDWLKSRSNSMIRAMIYLLIFSTCFILYGIDLRYVFYPALLCLLAALAFGLVDFYRFKKQRQAILLLKEQAEMDEPLDTGIKDLVQTPADRNWLEIVELLEAQKQKLETRQFEKSRDQLDRFSLWAHQIKIPITAINLALQRPELDRMSLRRNLGQVDRYVNLSMACLRLNMDQTDYLFERFDMDDLIREVIRSFSLEFISKGLRLDYQPIDFDLINDRKWIGLVLEQLLSNAIKYSDAGTITIYAKDRQIIIEDQGPGIQVQDLKRIMQKGFTGRNGHQSAQSSGLGLWICQNVCDNLSVHFEIDSIKNRGTRVLLQFPKDQIKNKEACAKH